jgi:hypothetical protein
MQTITTTQVLNYEYKRALELVSCASFVEKNETVKIIDGSGWEVEIKKPLVKKYQLVADYNEEFDKQKWWHSNKLGYQDLTDNQVLLLAEEVDFEAWCLENKFKKRYFLRDQQEANLGDIESDVFCSLQDLAERLEIYFIDYLGEKD